MGRRVLSVIFVIALIVLLPVFSYAAESADTMPGGYTRLEYVESNGSQYIDTGFKPNNNTRVTLVFDGISDSSWSSNKTLFGVSQSGLTSNYSLRYRDYSLKYYYGYTCYFGSGYFVSSYDGGFLNQSIVGKHLIDFYNGVFNVDGSSSSVSSAAFQADYSLLFGCVNSVGTPYGFVPCGYWYSMQVYDNGTLIRDYEPCINADGVVGFWEHVNGTFVSSLGTDSYIAGTVIEVIPGDDSDNTGETGDTGEVSETDNTYISSGFSYSVDIEDSSLSVTDRYFNFSFGEQPAGTYLINVYHDSVSCSPSLQFSSGGRSISSVTNGSVTNFVYSHDGGDMSFKGHVTLSYSGNVSSVDGYYKGITNYDPDLMSGPISGSYEEYPSLNFSFSISDVVAVPVSLAAPDDYGFFSPIINFFLDHFNKDEEAYTGATSPELSEDINSASSMIEQEKQFMKDINTQITGQSSAVDPSTVLNGIEGSSNVFASMLWVSSIVSAGIVGLGIFQFIIYVPMILGIVSLVIGRGSSLAVRRSSSHSVNVKKGSDQ